MTIDRAKVWKEFGEAVNMAPAEIENWLKRTESKKVGWKGSDRARASVTPADAGS